MNTNLFDKNENWSLKMLFDLKMLSLQGCQSVPLKKPETDGKNLKKRLNLNKNSQMWAENK